MVNYHHTRILSGYYRTTLLPNTQVTLLVPVPAAIAALDNLGTVDIGPFVEYRATPYFTVPKGTAEALANGDVSRLNKLLRGPAPHWRTVPCHLLIDKTTATVYLPFWYAVLKNAAKNTRAAYRKLHRDIPSWRSIMSYVVHHPELCTAIESVCEVMRPQADSPADWYSPSYYMNRLVVDVRDLVANDLLAGSSRD